MRTRKYRARNRLTTKYANALQIGGADRTFIRMKYIDYFVISSTSGAAYYNASYRANDPFDPDAGAGGESAHLFAQYAAEYNRYVVHGSKAVVRITSIASNSQGRFRATLYPNVTQVSITDHAGAQLQPYNKSVWCDNSTTGEGTKWMKNYMSTAKIYGETKDNISLQSSYGANTNANPTNLWYWNINVFTDDELSEPQFNCEIRITHYVEFGYPKIDTDQ